MFYFEIIDIPISKRMIGNYTVFKTLNCILYTIADVNSIEEKKNTLRCAIQ